MALLLVGLIPPTVEGTFVSPKLPAQYGHHYLQARASRWELASMGLRSAWGRAQHGKGEDSQPSLLEEGKGHPVGWVAQYDSHWKDFYFYNCINSQEISFVRLNSYLLKKNTFFEIS